MDIAGCENAGGVDCSSDSCQNCKSACTSFNYGANASVVNKIDISALTCLAGEWLELLWSDLNIFQFCWSLPVKVFSLIKFDGRIECSLQNICCWRGILFIEHIHYVHGDAIQLLSGRIQQIGCEWNWIHIGGMQKSISRECRSLHTNVSKSKQHKHQYKPNGVDLYRHSELWQLEWIHYCSIRAACTAWKCFSPWRHIWSFDVSAVGTPGCLWEMELLSKRFKHLFPRWIDIFFHLHLKGFQAYFLNVFQLLKVRDFATYQIWPVTTYQKFLSGVFWFLLHIFLSTCAIHRKLGAAGEERRILFFSGSYSQVVKAFQSLHFRALDITATTNIFESKVFTYFLNSIFIVHAVH